MGSWDGSVFQSVLVQYHAQALLTEVVVDVCCLQGKVPGGVQGVPLVLRRLIRRLTDGQQI